MDYKNMNKNFMIVIFFLQIALFVSCNKETNQANSISIIEELPIFYCKKSQNNFIDNSEIINKILILNSKEDVESNFTKIFLESFPKYLQVDYNKYSVLVRTAPVDYVVINRNIYLFLLKDHNYQYYIDYLVGDVCSVNDYYIERIAIVVNKISSNSNIEIVYGIHKNVENK